MLYKNAGFNLRVVRRTFRMFGKLPIMLFIRCGVLSICRAAFHASLRRLLLSGLQHYRACWRHQSGLYTKIDTFNARPVFATIDDDGNDVFLVFDYVSSRRRLRNEGGDINGMDSWSVIGMMSRGNVVRGAREHRNGR